jgi:polyhydroxybutyrate depolymerase
MAATSACARSADRPKGAAIAHDDAADNEPNTAAERSAGCASDQAAPPSGQTSETLAFGGLDRTYLRYVPATYEAGEPAPVVFEFHGHGSSAARQIAYGDFRPLSDRHGFVLVVPDGQGTPRHFTLLGAAGAEADDVEFAKALLDRIEADLCIDPRRVYATGMSNGGALSSVLACRAPDRFAAVAPVAAFFFVPGCASATTSRPAPLLAIMGDSDPVVPYAGGRVNCCGNPNIPAAEATVASFAEQSHCAEPPVDDHPKPTIRHRHWTGCSADNAVELYTVEGGGHTWPGSSFKVDRLGATSDQHVATDTIWAFFEQHPRPASKA